LCDFILLFYLNILQLILISIELSSNKQINKITKKKNWRMNLVNILKSIDFTFFYRKKQINYDNLAESQLG